MQPTEPLPHMRASKIPSTREIRTMYAYLAVFAYLLYGMGYVTPYLREDLRLSASAVGLHALALALGSLAAGLSVHALTRRAGPRGAVRIAVVVCVAAVLLVVAAPVVAVSLAGAFLIGLGGGTLGTNVNITLGGSGDGGGRKLLARANAWAMASAMASPLAIALAASLAHNWRAAILLAVAGLTLVTLAGRQPASAADPSAAPAAPLSAAPAPSHGAAAMHLPAAFWRAWTFVVLAVAIEFSFVFWGSTLIEARTGSSTDEATFLASLFVGGMLLGRVALGAPRAVHVSSRRLLLAGIAISVVGASLAWLSPYPAASALGLFLGGAGTGALYPLGVAVALAAAPGAAVAAGARLTLASGMAILAAPSALGAMSDQVGVVAAWPIVLALAAGALALGLVTTRPRAEDRPQPAELAEPLSASD